MILTLSRIDIDVSDTVTVVWADRIEKINGLNPKMNLKMNPKMDPKVSA